MTNKKLIELIDHSTLLRAGGTDLQERLRHHPTSHTILDLSTFPELATISGDNKEGVRIGATTTIATAGTDPTLNQFYAGFAQAAANLATPQIRHVATVGGNLLQHNRCWYYRHPQFSCFKKGGDSCPARTGNHRYAACADLGDCISVHPSTLAVAALAYDAKIEINQSEIEPLASLYGDGTAHQDHLLPTNSLLTALILPPISHPEFSFYQRATSRAQAEWPLVELCLRLTLLSGKIDKVAIAVGSIANIPLRLTKVEQLLQHKPITPQLIQEAANLAITNIKKPLPQTNYKLNLLSGLLIAALEEAATSSIS